ncbi:hypothetical protein N0V93_005739 [Gnomoniopsis smithogilvyi]|uniref:Uncharacterized protein n=1 Tax=Gnomoniopsis smithogilvyi TaxID=1191159 RepID=A0A9W9CX02_9PEZI|nr:hypothetical protein N0V93_005739 [Gnomoniopsis smithogilvyi]
MPGLSFPLNLTSLPPAPSVATISTTSTGDASFAAVPLGEQPQDIGCAVDIEPPFKTRCTHAAEVYVPSNSSSTPDINVGCHWDKDGSMHRCRISMASGHTGRICNTHNKHVVVVVVVVVVVKPYKSPAIVNRDTVVRDLTKCHRDDHDCHIIGILALCDGDQQDFHIFGPPPFRDHDDHDFDVFRKYNFSVIIY